jgi:heme-degrading monooxygenase HmoA
VFARVSIMSGKPEKMEEGIRDYKEQVLPAVRKMAGFRGARLLVDRKNGKNLGITFWETETDLQTSASAANKLRSQASQKIAAATAPVVEIYEVAVEG